PTVGLLRAREIAAFFPHQPQPEKAVLVPRIPTQRLGVVLFGALEVAERPTHPALASPGGPVPREDVRRARVVLERAPRLAGLGGAVGVVVVGLGTGGGAPPEGREKRGEQSG